MKHKDKQTNKQTKNLKETENLDPGGRLRVK